MITAIKKQLLGRKDDWMVMALFILGCGILGRLLFHFILITEDDVEAYFPMAALLACLGAVLFAVIQTANELRVLFNMQVSMGCTRKHFFVSFLVSCFFGNLINLLLILGINLAENAINAAMYPTWENELDLVPYILKWGIPVAMLLSLLGMLAGALMLRFGKAAFWIMWAMWMFLCIGFPQFSHAIEDAPDSLYGRIGTAFVRFVKAVPVNMWTAAGIAAGIASFAGIWVLIRKQQVMV